MQFNRQYEIIIGTPGTNGKKITDLRMNFRIKKTLTSEPNTCQLTIYNLNENSRKSIEKVQDICTIKAGFLENNSISEIFNGYISAISHEIQSPDILTELTVDDGSKIIKEAKFNKTYSAGVGLKTLVKDVVKSFNIPNDLQKSLLGVVDKKFMRGFSFCGESKEALNQLSQIAGIEWSIQNNELQLLKPNETNQTHAFVISPSTGLIGSPARINEANKNAFSNTTAKGNLLSDKSLTNQTDDRPGWKFKALLLPKVQPGHKIYLQCRDIPTKTAFKVVEVEHAGDTHEGEWTSTIQVIDL